MKLLDNWKDILTKAWSVRLIIIAAVLSGVEAVLPLFVQDMPQGRFAALSGLVTAAALFARVVAQEGVTKNEQSS